VLRIFTHISAFDGIIKIDIWTYNDFLQKRKLIITVANRLRDRAQNSFPFLARWVGTLLKLEPQPCTSIGYCSFQLSTDKFCMSTETISRSKHLSAYDVTAPTDWGTKNLQNNLYAIPLKELKIKTVSVQRCSSKFLC